MGWKYGGGVTGVSAASMKMDYAISGNSSIMIEMSSGTSSWTMNSISGTTFFTPSKTLFLTDVEFRGGVKFDDNGPARIPWHDIEILSNGARVGKMGALRFLLAPGAKNLPISAGYHTIEVDGMGYKATLGTRTIKLDLDGYPIVETITVEKPVIKTIYKTEVIPMNWTLSNILIVAVICIVTMAVVKRITIKRIARAVVKIVVWPFAKLARKGYQEAKEAWTDEEAAEEKDRRGEGMTRPR